MGVTIHHQLGNIAFTHRAAGSEHNEEGTEGDIFHFYYSRYGAFVIATCPFLYFLVLPFFTSAI